MSLRSLENAILIELKVVAKNNNLRVKDIVEWSTSKVEPHEGEVIHYLPGLKVYCAVKQKGGEGCQISGSAS